MHLTHLYMHVCMYVSILYTCTYYWYIVYTTFCNHEVFTITGIGTSLFKFAFFHLFSFQQLFYYYAPYFAQEL